MASFSPSTGLSYEGTLIDTADIISLLPSSATGEYTLFHTSSSKPELHKISLVAPPAALISRYSLSTLPPHLNPSAVNISIIISSGSGTGKADSYWTGVLQPLLSEYGLNNESYKIHPTTSATTIYELATSITSATEKHEKQQSIIILSGDTLLFELFNALPVFRGDVHRPIISVLPLGTGNALSTSLSRSSPPLSTLLLGSPQRLPSFKASFSPGSRFIPPESDERKELPGDGALRGSLVLSWGFHASLVADAETKELRKKGVERFKIAAKENLLPEPHGYKGVISVLQDGGNKDWVELVPGGEGDHFYTLATMVPNLEETLCISPASKPLGGELHVVHFPVVSPQEVMEIMGMAYSGGKHVQDPRVRYEKVEGIRIEVEEVEERWRRICIDGAIVALPEAGWVEVRPVEGNVDVVFRE